MLVISINYHFVVVNYGLTAIVCSQIYENLGENPVLYRIISL